VAVASVERRLMIVAAVDARVCTLTIAWQAFADAPVVVAANRDEALDRPSEPPARVAGTPGFVAPRDAEAGGTWIGVNDAGVFVGITNRWASVAGGGERSRGLLVRDALGATSAEAATRIVENALREHRYDGFNLVLADENAAVFVEWDGTARVRNLSPGVHVVVNVGADGEFFEPDHRPEMGPEQADNATRVQEALWPEPGERPGEWLDRASVALADHDYGVCVHSDGPDTTGGYGTRSSSLVTVHDDGRVDYQFAPGPPCETPYEPVTATVGERVDAGEGQL
jgi:uncharacterized protein with NRDE domain